MSNKTQKILWISLFVAIALGALWQFYPLPNADQRINSLPFVGPGYRGKDVPLTAFEEEFFKGVNVIKRIYTVGNKTLFITILDGTNNRHVVHDPYFCFKGSGWNIESAETVNIPNGIAKLLKIEKNQVKKEALFWFSDGTKNYDSPYQYWKETTLRRLSLGKSGPEPVLIIVQPIEEGSLNWKNLETQIPELFTI